MNCSNRYVLVLAILAVTYSFYLIRLLPVSRFSSPAVSTHTLFLAILFLTGAGCGAGRMWCSATAWGWTRRC
jgi:hypothetical protein